MQVVAQHDSHDTFCVLVPQGRRLTMIGTDRLPGWPILVDLLPIVPGADIDVFALILEIIGIDAMAAQFGKMDRIDLHAPNIDRAVCVFIDRFCAASVIFLHGDRPENTDVHLVIGRRIVKAISTCRGACT